MSQRQRTIKTRHIALLAIFSAYSALAAGVKLAGFEIGEAIDVCDERARAVRYLAAPAIVNLEQGPAVNVTTFSRKPTAGKASLPGTE